MNRINHAAKCTHMNVRQAFQAALQHYQSASAETLLANEIDLHELTTFTLSIPMLRPNSRWVRFKTGKRHQTAETRVSLTVNGRRVTLLGLPDPKRRLHWFNRTDFGNYQLRFPFRNFRSAAALTERVMEVISPAAKKAGFVPKPSRESAPARQINGLSISPP